MCINGRRSVQQLTTQQNCFNCGWRPVADLVSSLLIVFETHPIQDCRRWWSFRPVTMTVTALTVTITHFVQVVQHNICLLIIITTVVANGDIATFITWFVRAS